MTSKPRKDAEKPTCAVPDCRREPTTRGLCGAHYATHRGLAKED